MVKLAVVMKGLLTTRAVWAAIGSENWMRAWNVSETEDRNICQ